MSSTADPFIVTQDRRCLYVHLIGGGRLRISVDSSDVTVQMFADDADWDTPIAGVQVGQKLLQSAEEG